MAYETLEKLVKQYEDLVLYGDDARSNYRRWKKFINDIESYASRNNFEVNDVLLTIDDIFG